MSTKERKAPDFSGVPGELMRIDAVDVEFGLRKWRTSPYDPLLRQLEDAGDAAVLRFGNASARVSIAARSKKLGLKILFGEKDGALYVRLAPSPGSAMNYAPAPAPAPGVEDPGGNGSAAEASVRELVLNALAIGPATVAQIVTRVSPKNRFAKPNTVDGVLARLLRERVVKVKDTKDDVERWALA